MVSGARQATGVFGLPDGAASVRVATIRFLAQDEDEEDYFRAVWYLASALIAVGAGSRVVPALQDLFEEAFANWDRDRMRISPH
jgi:hypothetical protein